jgi:hypothetical protein
VEDRTELSNSNEYDENKNKIPVDQATASSRKCSIGAAPLLSPFINTEGKYLEMSEFSLGKSRAEEHEETEGDHKESRERRLDSFCFEETTAKYDTKKNEESNTKSSAGLLVQINQTKINNNEAGAVTVQNNILDNLKKKKKLKGKDEEQSVSSYNEQDLQFMAPVIVPEASQLNMSAYRVGLLSLEERRLKITKYKEKRMRRTWAKKISYDCRKRVADNRLRVKGRFVTKDQAFALLGMTPQDLCENESIKQLLNDSSCSIVTTTNNIKIRNIQTLLHSQKEAKPCEGKQYGIDVEIVSQNKTENTVEIKIEKRKQL